MDVDQAGDHGCVRQLDHLALRGHDAAGADDGDAASAHVHVDVSPVVGVDTVEKAIDL